MKQNTKSNQRGLAPPLSLVFLAILGITFATAVILTAGFGLVGVVYGESSSTKNKLSVSLERCRQVFGEGFIEQEATKTNVRRYATERFFISEKGNKCYFTPENNKMVYRESIYNS